jgi:hypothetical protein
MFRSQKESKMRGYISRNLKQKAVLKVFGDFFATFVE